MPLIYFVCMYQFIAHYMLKIQHWWSIKKEKGNKQINVDKYKRYQNKEEPPGKEKEQKYK